MEDEGFYQTMRAIVLSIIKGSSEHSTDVPESDPNGLVGIEQAPKVTYNGSWGGYTIKDYVGSKFGPRGGKPHNGVDINIKSGTPIQYLKQGKVIVTGNDPKGWGWWIVIQADGENDCILLGHLSAVNVKQGDIVNKNQIVAATGGIKNALGAGNSSDEHLHYEYRIKVAENPPYGVEINPFPNDNTFPYIHPYIKLLKP